MRTLFVIGIILIVIWLFFGNYEHSQCGGRGDIYVLKSRPRKGAAGALLCDLNSRILYFRDYLVNKYPKDPDIMRFGENYASGVITESDRKTYTINKGQNNDDKIHICLRNPQTGQFYDINTLMFVILHEITHMIHPEFHIDEHPPEFWKMNVFVLKEAEKSGIYRNIDYSRRPILYCDGIVIERNPVFF